MIRITSQVILFLLALSTPTFAADKKSDETNKNADGNTIDISGAADKLIVLEDGKKHFIAVVPSGDLYENLYYGDGKKFHKQVVTGGSRAGTESWDRVLWEPRVDERWKGNVGFKNGKYTVQCGDRATEFKPLAADEQAKVLKTASFFKPLWIHRPYALARDNKGTYYFVDHLREPENNKNFRLYAGPRGNLKLLKMTNVVSDSKGDIFTTKKGELRLVLDKKKPSWFAGKAETSLINLPIEENRIMIYSELGVYAGQRLGTPCDDLL